MAKDEIEFSLLEDVPWTVVEGTDDKLLIKIVSQDPTTGEHSRMVRFEPGCDTSRLGTLEHDFWEEAVIMDGSVHDLVLERTFAKGAYACRPPGMRHGPWRSEGGAVTFEIRYYR